MPFEIAESGNDVVADKSVVFGTGYLTDELQIQAKVKKNLRTRSREKNPL